MSALSIRARKALAAARTPGASAGPGPSPLSSPVFTPPRSAEQSPRGLGKSVPLPIPGAFALAPSAPLSALASTSPFTFPASPTPSTPAAGPASPFAFGARRTSFRHSDAQAYPAGFDPAAKRSSLTPSYPAGFDPAAKRSSLTPSYPAGFDPTAKRPSLTPSYLSVQSTTSRGSRSPSERERSASASMHTRRYGDGALLSDSDEEDGADAQDERGTDGGDEADAEPELGAVDDGGGSLAPSPLARLSAGATRPWPAAYPTRDANAIAEALSSDDERRVGATSVLRRPSARRRSTKDRPVGLVLPAKIPVGLGASLPRGLVHQESRDSINTVLGAGAVGAPRSFSGPVHPLPGAGSPLRRPSALPAVDSPVTPMPITPKTPTTGRQNGSDHNVFLNMPREQRHEVVLEEQRFRRMGWETLREAVEGLANQVRTLDTSYVQGSQCAFRAMFKAAQSLPCSSATSSALPRSRFHTTWRSTLVRSMRWVYVLAALTTSIDLLARLQFHAPAAYIRKFSGLDELSALTAVCSSSSSRSAADVCSEGYHHPHSLWALQ
jgi:hypothetical protein